MFNVMVTTGENAWEEGAYVWTTARMLEYTDDNLKAEFGFLTPEVLERLASFPTLFMYERGYTGTPKVGRIVKIQQRGPEIRVIFEFDENVSPLTLDKLFEHRWGLSLSDGEFTRTHWSVKDGDLYQVLRDANLLEAPQSPPNDVAELPGDGPAKVDVRPSKVFLVHGRDEGVKHAVARFLETRVGVEVCVLSERPNGGREILTKFQEEADGASYAVVLMSGDDSATLNSRLMPTGQVPPPPRARARQNVIFELGFFIGKLGASRVCALVPPDVEKPSDFDGIVYVPYDDQEGWQRRLVTELHAADVPVSPTWWQIGR